MQTRQLRELGGIKAAAGVLVGRLEFIPQLLSGLLARHPQPAYDREKNDVWGLGITMICAAAVCSYLEFYDFANGLLNTDAIHQRLESLARLGYSSYFVKCVSNMVNMNEEYRPSLRDIQKFLGPLQHSQPAHPR